MGRLHGSTAERSEGEEWVVCGEEDTSKEKAEDVLRKAEGMNNKVKAEERERERRSSSTK